MPRLPPREGPPDPGSERYGGIRDDDPDRNKQMLSNPGNIEGTIQRSSRSGFVRRRPTEGIFVDRLSLASPLEAVLVAVASDVKPLGYAVVAMGLLKTGLGVVMDWQKHRADLRREDQGTSLEALSEGERALPADVFIRMQRHASVTPHPVLGDELVYAVSVISHANLVRLQTDVDTPGRAAD
ncbi:hypothetical protein MED01_005687 [Micromonospora sp. MED01]|uniref:hypothetical protein n=1 Tax=Micromonospora alfalfae TaxID=2911212 RepID=UPI001EE8660F|nr:hypothetical protein [Micromonospora alfalfae]MCG5466648.1 hypothetical protein [Micromonospora alfalfae]